MMGSLKNKHWFPHPANLRNDRRMRRAMKDFPGAVAYGVIVLMIEVLRNEPDFKYPVRDLDLLASEFDISLPILQTLIGNYNFFEFKKFESEEVFVSPVLNELMIPYLQKQSQNKIAGEVSAKKRKLKQEQQLHLLSLLGSNQHVLDMSSLCVEENRKEENRKEKKIEEKNLSILNFQVFKQFILEKYINRQVCFGPLDYLQSTSISVTSQGYLHNDTSHKDLDGDAAILTWKWMFDNQDQLCKYTEEYI